MRNFDEETQDRETRQNQAAANAARYDFEHWSKTGEIRPLKLMPKYEVTIIRTAGLSVDASSPQDAIKQAKDIASEKDFDVEESHAVPCCERCGATFCPTHHDALCPKCQQEVGDHGDS